MSSEQRGEQLRKIMQDAHDNTERRLNETGHAGFLVRDNPTLVKPFDMTRLLRHAFHAGKEGGLWVDYDPTEFGPHIRIDAAISGAVTAEPVATQWRCVENGEPRTSWYDIAEGDLDGWKKFAGSNIAPNVGIEYRDLYTRPQSSPLSAGDAGEIERLRKALEPFADKAEQSDAYAARMGFAPSFDEYATEWTFTFGQLRAARAALRDSNGVV